MGSKLLKVNIQKELKEFDLDVDFELEEVKEKIKQMIASEDPRKPISDAAIAQKLADNGLDIARRTVAKYRESMNIPPTTLRRKH